MEAATEESENMEEGEKEQERKEEKEGVGERENEVWEAMERMISRDLRIRGLGALKRWLGVGKELFWPGWHPEGRGHLPS